MTYEELCDFLLKLGAPRAGVADMARQLDRRARQISEQRGQGYEQALASLLALYKESWAANSVAAPPGRVQSWEVTSRKSRGSFRIFDLFEQTVRSPQSGKEGTVYVLETNDWVNVVVETIEKQTLLIEQFRFGTWEASLEIVGGVMDKGESPTDAARRELREETGYEAEDFLLLGAVRPNPAFLNNRQFTVLARGARRTAEPSFDAMEEIATRLVAPEDIPRLIADGKIGHALVIVAFQWYELFRAGKLEVLRSRP